MSRVGDGRPLRAFAAALLLALGAPVRAEVFKFDSELVPDSRTLIAKYMFYVYAHKDAPDKSKGHPYVQFENFELEAVDDDDEKKAKESATASNSGTVQISLIPWEDFWTLVDPHRFCSVVDDVQWKVADAPSQLLLKNVRPSNYSAADVHVHTVTGPAKKGEAASRQALKRTGVYLLAISNCGEATDVTISGEVIVRNSFGFLPGNEYGKLMVYRGLATCYFMCATFWVALSLRWWQELIYIHYCLSAVLALGLLEAILWWGYLASWNASGSNIQIFLSSAILFSGAKTVVTFMVVLVMALGKGVTKPNLEGATLMKLFSLGILYVVLDFTRMYVIDLRQRYSLSVKFVGACIIPTVTLSAIITCWAFAAISGLLKELREQGQDIKLRLYQRFTCIMVFAMLASVLSVCLTLYDQPGRTSDWWSYHWMCTDAMSGGSFLLFLASMMCIWAPSEGTKRMAYSQQVNVANDEEDAFPAPTGFGNDKEDGAKRGDIASEWLGVDASLGQTSKVEVAETEPINKDSLQPNVIGASKDDGAMEL